MTKRAWLAALVGGVAMFAWSSIAHMVLPLGRAGIQEIPNEQPVLDALRTALGQSHGLYMYPAFGTGNDTQLFERKLAANPSGMILFHPPGGKMMEPSQLVTEFLTELAEVLLAVWLLARARVETYAARAGFVAVAGLMAAITTNVPYWNWYGFPLTYTAAYAFTEFAGYVAAGLVVARMIKS